MKKIFIILSISVIFIFFINNSKASAQYNFADEYGVNMIYKTLYLNDIVYQDFYFTGNWGDDTDNTFYFGYRAFEESLEELFNLWYLGQLTPYFVEVYFFGGGTLEYLNDRGIEPVGDIGWTIEAEYLFIIVNKYYLRDTYSHYFDDPGLTEEQATLLAIADETEYIRVDTWVVTETTSEYETGYNTGFQHGYNNGHAIGYNRGFNDGEISKQNEIDAILPGLLQDEYERGYDDGLQVSQGEAYDRGYIDGANESFIATMDKWLVPAIIIVMLIGGFFAIARKKKEGEI